MLTFQKTLIKPTVMLDSICSSFNILPAHSFSNQKVSPVVKKKKILCCLLHENECKLNILITALHFKLHTFTKSFIIGNGLSFKKKKRKKDTL